MKVKYRHQHRLQRLIVLIGLPATGKSTLARFLNERKSYEVVSADKFINNLALTNKITVTQAMKDFRKEVMEEILKQTRVVKVTHGNVIFDLPNLTSEERYVIYEGVSPSHKRSCDKIAIYFETPLEGILARNSIKQLDHLDHEEESLREMHARLEPPTSGEFDYVMKVYDHEMKDYQMDYLTTLQKT